MAEHNRIPTTEELYELTGVSANPIQLSTAILTDALVESARTMAAIAKGDLAVGRQRFDAAKFLLSKMLSRDTEGQAKEQWADLVARYTEADAE